MAGASPLSAYPNSLKTHPGHISGRLAEERARRMPCTLGFSKMTTCSTREIEPVYRFLGKQTHYARTHGRTGISRSCGLPAPGGLRAAQGAGITLFALLSRLIDSLDSLDA